MNLRINAQHQAAAGRFFGFLIQFFAGRYIVIDGGVECGLELVDGLGMEDDDVFDV